MKQVYNPYLPLYEYVPDGEPHVFGDRLYIYGSHDLAGGTAYCQGDYVTWSAPVNDLTQWRYEGIIYRREQDPSNAGQNREIWAPDVCRGPDGKYYLYYCLAFMPEIGVAVSESPAGPFEFYGHVRYAEQILNGKKLEEYLPFDPAVFVDEDNRVFLYYGFSPAAPLKRINEEGMEEELELETSPGAMVVELMQDMLTAKNEPEMMIPGGRLEKGTSYEGHGFFEASSMRKIGNRYYFVYSSKLSHELCYAVSNFPDRDFVYGGTLISNGDIGYQGNKLPRNMMGNNHGGLVEAAGQWYVFYHRQTHGTECSRQGCAEKIEILENGQIKQVEMTSCGLNAGPLAAKGCYPAAIACNLLTPVNREKITYGQSRKEEMPYIFEEPAGERREEHIHYIANIKDGVTVGYKYFSCENVKEIEVNLRGEGMGRAVVYLDNEGAQPAGSAEFCLKDKENWSRIAIPVSVENGVHALFITFEGNVVLQFREFVWK